MEGTTALDQSLATNSFNFAQLQQVKQTAAQLTPNKQVKVAQDFESVFASMMLKQMRESLTEGLFGSDSGDVYGGMFDLFIGQHMAKSQPMGIDRMVKAYLERMEAASTSLNVQN